MKPKKKPSSEQISRILEIYDFIGKASKEPQPAPDPEPEKEQQQPK